MSEVKTISPAKELDMHNLTRREKLCVKVENLLLLFMVAILRPGEYDHQIDAWIKFIREEL